MQTNSHGAKPTRHNYSTNRPESRLTKNTCQDILVNSFLLFYATMSVSVCPSDCDGSALWSRCMPGRGEGSSRAMLATARLSCYTCYTVLKDAVANSHSLKEVVPDQWRNDISRLMFIFSSNVSFHLNQLYEKWAIIFYFIVKIGRKTVVTRTAETHCCGEFSSVQLLPCERSL